MFLELYHSDNYFLDRVNIEGLSSLKTLVLCLSSIEGISFGNQSSLKDLTLFKSEFNNDSIIKLHKMCSNIEELSLKGNFSSLSFDSFLNLKKLSVIGSLLEDFDFELFKNICNQLEYLLIGFDNMHNDGICKLLNGHNFTKVLTLNIFNSKIKRLEKKLFEGFPKIQSLDIYKNKELKTIDKDAFSNLKNLKCLSLTFNEQLSELDPELFSCLENLEKLDLRYNKLTRFDLKIMDYIVKINEINLEDNGLGFRVRV